MKQGESRLEFVWKIEFEKDFSIKKSTLFDGLVEIKASIDYGFVDEILHRFNLLDEPHIEKNYRSKKEIKEILDGEILDSIIALYPVTKKIRERRLLTGYEFFSSEVVMRLDQNSDIESIHIDSETYSHNLVEECMLLANIESAKMVEDELEGSGIYRVHEAPEDDKIRELFFDLESMGFVSNKKSFHDKISDIQSQCGDKKVREEVDKIVIRAQSQACYSEANIGHFGLGFESYSHFTSPIRRYPDLILHRLLKDIIYIKKNSAKGKKYGKNDSEKEIGKRVKKISYILDSLPPLCMDLNRLERESSRAEMDYRDRKFARFAMQNIGEELECVIIDSREPALAKALDFIPSALLVLKGFEGEKLDRIRVKIDSVSLIENRIFCSALDSQMGFKKSKKDEKKRYRKREAEMKPKRERGGESRRFHEKPHKKDSKNGKRRESRRDGF